jgi:uncharacterized protein (TIGR03118 family)
MRRNLSRALSAQLKIEVLEDRSNPSTAFLQTDLVADQPGFAPVTDPTLVNGWGIGLSPTGGPFWVSSNNGTPTSSSSSTANLSEIYGGDVAGSPITQPFKVTIPTGNPTGQVFNSTTSDFMITDGTNTAKSAFIFASENGTVSAWAFNVGVASGAKPPSVMAETPFTSTDNAVYKGIALANNGSGNFLYLTDFRNNKIDVLNSSFQKVTLGTGGFDTFTDPKEPKGFAPFNIALINGKLYVSYAKQNAQKHDDVAGNGNGFIDVFETNGKFDQRLVTGGALNSPWGMVLATPSFGDFSNDLIVGNFGNGWIHAYNPTTGALVGTLAAAPHKPVIIDGLWGLSFGNGKGGGDVNSLYFAAGPDGESHGVFGKLTANPAGTNPVSATLTGTTLNIVGSPGNDNVHVNLNKAGQVVVMSSGQNIGTFDRTAIATIEFNGLGGDDTFAVSHKITSTVIADGGAGNNTLSGGGGDNILIGGIGRNTLNGGLGQNILIGGDGKATINAGSSDDILIAGSTAYDNNPTQLLQLLSAWSVNDSYTNRIATIRAGSATVPKLDMTTVTTNSLKDHLNGGDGLDWFWGGPNVVITNRTPGEQLN